MLAAKVVLVHLRELQTLLAEWAVETLLGNKVLAVLVMRVKGVMAPNTAAAAVLLVMLVTAAMAVLTVVLRVVRGLVVLAAAVLVAVAIVMVAVLVEA